MKNNTKKFVAGLTMSAFLLAPGAAFADTLYQVPVSLQQAANPDKASIAAGAFDPNAEVLVKDNGQSRYDVMVKPIEMMNLKGNLTKLFVYGDQGKKDAEKSVVADKTKWTFMRDKAKEKDIKVSVWVDVMDQMKGGTPGANEQDALLRFNWDAAKVLKEDKAPATPDTKPAEGSKTTSKPIGNAPVQVFFQGQPIKSDSAPILKDGRTYLPLRAVFETLGAKVDWKEAERTVYGEKNGVKIRLTIGAKEAMVGDKTMALDAPAFISNGRTYVPVRFIGEAYGNKVDFAHVGKIAVIDIR